MYRYISNNTKMKTFFCTLLERVRESTILKKKLQSSSIGLKVILKNFQQKTEVPQKSLLLKFNKLCTKLYKVE